MTSKWVQEKEEFPGCFWNEPALFSVTALVFILENLGSLSNKINCRLIQEHTQSLDRVQDIYESPLQTSEWVNTSLGEILKYLK